MAGAGADLFIAAEPRWTRELGTAQKAGDSAPVALFTGSLVLIAPLESTVSFAPVPRADLAALIADGRLVIDDPAHVPAGAYTREALEWLGAWQEIAQRTVFAGNVR